MNKDELIEKICKRVIVVFGILASFNFILLINKKSYALFTKTIVSDKIVVHIETGDSLPAVNVVKNTIGEVGGIIGIKEDNTLTTNKINVREYRYSGLNVNNYIYFNCNEVTTKETASSDCEIWRIVGIFKNEEGVEHLKIVRNNVLTKEMFPATFEANGTTYNIQSASGDYAFWNSKVSGTNNNDWATAGLQYWLNAGSEKETKSPSDGYMSYLNKNAKSMITDTKYYLGTVIYYADSDELVGIWDTPKEVYKNERAVNGCEGGIGPAANSNRSSVEANTTCRVWANNKTTWDGKIALLYPSDYGFTASSENWDTKLAFGIFDKGPSNTSWLQRSANHSSYEWLLSASTQGSNYAAHWRAAGAVGTYYVNDGPAVRPTLYLTSDVKITSGNGTLEEPYFLEK